MCRWGGEHKILQLLHAIARSEDVCAARRLHCRVLLHGLPHNAAFIDCLIRLYASSGCLLEANIVFSQSPSASVYTWYGIILAHGNHLQHGQALALYHAMLQFEIVPNSFVFSCILRTCCNGDLLFDGMLVHHQAVSCGLESDVIVGTAIIDMYAKCVLLTDARDIFERLPDKNIVCYGAIITGYAKHGLGQPVLELYKRMQCADIKPNRVIFLGLLAACGSLPFLKPGRHIHDLIIRNGIVSDISIANTIVDMYARFGSMEEAYKVFVDLPHPNIVSWGALITGYAQQGQFEAAVKHFKEMQTKDIHPNRVIFLGVLHACSNMQRVDQAEDIHNQIVEEDLESDQLIKTALISMWATLGNLEKARHLFNESNNLNIVTWSVMLSGYVQQEQDIPALQLFEVMQQLNIRPDEFVFTCVLKACGSKQTLMEAMLIHNQIIKEGLEKDVHIGSSLIDAYGKCAVLKEARKVFDNLSEKNEVSWGAMLAGYNQHGEELPALELFKKGLNDSAKPDRVQLLCILKACGSIGTVCQGKMVHDLLRNHGMRLDVVLGNALIDMYAKCGELEDAFLVFGALETRDVVSWGSLIAGCAQHGLFQIVLVLIEAMQCEGLKPNDKIFSSVLSACGHAGLAKEGYQQYTAMMVDHKISPSVEHVNCMVDIFSRAGCLREAEKLLESMPQPLNSLAWTSFLTACRTYGNMKLGDNAIRNWVI